MKYSIAEANLEKNSEDILALWKRNFPETAEARFRWAYLENPRGRARCWLLRDTDCGRFVGSAALLPRAMSVQGKELCAGIAADFCVDKEYRGFNAAVLLQRAVTAACDDGGFDFIYGFPNKNSEAVHRRVGFVDLGKLSRFARPLKTEKKIAEHAGRLLAKVASAPVDLAMRLFSRESRYRRIPGTMVQVAGSFDARLDVLWEKLNRRVTVIGDKSSGFLDWRYHSNPHRSYQAFYVAGSEGGEIFGLIVYYTERGVCFICDLLAADENGALDRLLSEFLIFQRSQDLNSISVILLGSPSVQKALRSFGFYRREESSVVQIYCGKNANLRTVLPNSDSWLLFEGDRDI